MRKWPPKTKEPDIGGETNEIIIDSSAFDTAWGKQ